MSEKESNVKECRVHVAGSAADFDRTRSRGLVPRAETGSRDYY